MGTMGLQERMYSSRKNEEYASIVIKRYIDDYVAKKTAAFRPTKRGATGIYSLEDIEEMKKDDSSE
jgi:hypothetical protein